MVNFPHVFDIITVVHMLEGLDQVARFGVSKYLIAEVIVLINEGLFNMVLTFSDASSAALPGRLTTITVQSFVR